MPLLAALLLGMIEYGYFFYVAQSANSAARETARQLSVGNCQASGAAQNFAQSTSGINLTLTYGSPGNLNDTLPGVGETLQVQVTTDAKIIGYVPLPNGGSITRSVDTYVENTTSQGCPG